MKTDKGRFDSNRFSQALFNLVYYDMSMVPLALKINDKDGAARYHQIV